jgi:uncharacterized protein (DUF4213/DUF364 family)
MMVSNSILGLNRFLTCINDSRVNRLTIGTYWILVEAEHGTGLVANPQNKMSIATVKEYQKKFDNNSLYQLASLAKSDDLIERAIGCAAINANTNHYGLKLTQDNGLSLSHYKEEKIVVVGRFPNLEQKLPTAIVLERNPGPGDLPEHEAPNVIPDCTQLVITASTWANGSLPGLLKLVETAHVSLIGPGTPFSPILRQHGIHKLAGFLVQEPYELSRLIKNGAGVRQFKHLGIFGVLEL